MKKFLLKIDPPMPCVGTGSNRDDVCNPCPLLTAWAEAEQEGQIDRSLQVHPLCWRHLFIDFPNPTPEEKALEEFFITNFVVNHFKNKGTATVVGKCSVENIPGPYKRWKDEQDKAWYVVYRNKQGKERQVYAVYYKLFPGWDLFRA